MYRVIIFFFAIILIACKSDITQQVSIPIADTLRLNTIKNLLSLEGDLNAILTNDSLLKADIQYQKRIIDTLIIDILNYKDTKLDFLIITDKYTDIKKENKVLITKAYNNGLIIDSLKNKNIELTKELVVERNNINKINKLKSKIENDASELIITGINISGISYGGIFDKKTIITNKASKIDAVVIRCSLPKNKFAVSESKFISVKLYSSIDETYIEKTTTTQYNNEQVDIELLITPIKMAPGAHKVIVTMNNIIQYDTNFIVK